MTIGDTYRKTQRPCALFQEAVRGTKLKTREAESMSNPWATRQGKRIWKPRLVPGAYDTRSYAHRRSTPDHHKASHSLICVAQHELKADRARTSSLTGPLCYANDGSRSLRDMRLRKGVVRSEPGLGCQMRLPWATRLKSCLIIGNRDIKDWLKYNVERKEQ